MNPHFIFNALNGMQSILLLQGEQKANQYLGMLSKLLRYTLDNSVQERISLADELNYLRAYIELNKMRMGDSFEYCINQIKEKNLCENCPQLLSKTIQALISKKNQHFQEQVAQSLKNTITERQQNRATKAI